MIIVKYQASENQGGYKKKSPLYDSKLKTCGLQICYKTYKKIETLHATSLSIM